MLFAATDPAIIGAFVTAIGALVAGVFALRSQQSAKLVENVMSDREWLRTEINTLRSDIEAMEERHEEERSAWRLQAREMEVALLRCKDSEENLSRRVAELEAKS